MSDIFSEVDEELRREQLKRLWERYGLLFVLLILAVIVGIGGWRGYQHFEAQKAAKAGAAFEAAQTLSDQGKTQEAIDAFAKITQDGTSGYRLLARLREAAISGQRDAKAGAAAFDAVAADNSVPAPLRDLASLRAAQLLVDSLPYADIRTRLEPLAEPSRTFRHTARELLALSAWRSGDAAAARSWSDQVMSDAETPATVRARVETLTALLPAQAKS